MDFDELFPRNSKLFGLSAIAANQWLEAKWSKNLGATWEMISLADSLLVLAASWRQDSNLFVSGRFQALFFELREKLAIMAGKKVQDNRSLTRPSWKGFLDYRLTDEELAELDEWTPSSAEIFGAVDEATTGLYRVTLSYSPRTKLATCTLIDDDKSRKTAGYGLSTSDRDCSLALKAAVFKHVYVLERDWTRLLDKPSEGGRRG